MTNLPRKKAPSMRVTISEKYELANPDENIKAASIYKYSDGTVILTVVKNLERGERGTVKGYKTVASAKMLFARRYHTGEDKPVWEEVK